MKGQAARRLPLQSETLSGGQHMNGLAPASRGMAEREYGQGELYSPAVPVEFPNYSPPSSGGVRSSSFTSVPASSKTYMGNPDGFSEPIRVADERVAAAVPARLRAAQRQQWSAQQNAQNMAQQTLDRLQRGPSGDAGFGRGGPHASAGDSSEGSQVVYTSNGSQSMPMHQGRGEADRLDSEDLYEAQVCYEQQHEARLHEGLSERDALTYEYYEAETDRGPSHYQAQQGRRHDEQGHEYGSGHQQQRQQQQSLRHGQQREAGRPLLPPTSVRRTLYDDGSFSHAPKGAREDVGPHSQSFDQRRMTKQLSERAYAVPVQSGLMALPNVQGASSNYEQRQMTKQMSERGYAPARTYAFAGDRDGPSLPHQPARQLADRGAPDGGYPGDLPPADVELRRHLSERGVGQPPLPGRRREQTWQGGGVSMPDGELRRNLSERGVAAPNARPPQFLRMQSDRGVASNYRQGNEGQQRLHQQQQQQQQWQQAQHQDQQQQQQHQYQHQPYQQPSIRVYSSPSLFSEEQQKEESLSQRNGATHPDLDSRRRSLEGGSGQPPAVFLEPSRVSQDRSMGPASTTLPPMPHDQARGPTERAAPRQANDGQSTRMQQRSTPPLPQSGTRGGVTSAVPSDELEDELEGQGGSATSAARRSQSSVGLGGGLRGPAHRRSVRPESGTSDDEVDFQQRDRKFLLPKQGASRSKASGSRAPARRVSSQGGSREEKLRGTGSHSMPARRARPSEVSREEGRAEADNRDCVEHNSSERQDLFQRTDQREVNDTVEDAMNDGPTSAPNKSEPNDSLGGYDETDFPVAGVVGEDDEFDLYPIPVAAPLFCDGAGALADDTGGTVDNSNDPESEELYLDRTVETHQAMPYQAESTNAANAGSNRESEFDSSEFGGGRENSSSRQPRDFQSEPCLDAPGGVSSPRRVGHHIRAEQGTLEEAPVSSQRHLPLREHADETSVAELVQQADAPSAAPLASSRKDSKRPPLSLPPGEHQLSQPSAGEPSASSPHASSAPPGSSAPRMSQQQGVQEGGSLATLLGSAPTSSAPQSRLAAGGEAEHSRVRAGAGPGVEAGAAVAAEDTTAYSRGPQQNAAGGSGQHGSQLMKFLQMELPVKLPTVSGPGGPSSVEFVTSSPSPSLPYSGDGQEAEKSVVKKPLKSALKKSSSFKSPSHDGEHVVKAAGAPSGEDDGGASHLVHESERPPSAPEPKAPTTTSVVKAAALAPQKVLGNLLSRFRKDSSNSGVEDEDEEEEEEGGKAPLNISNPVSATSGANGYVPLRAVSSSTSGMSRTSSAGEFASEILPNGRRLVQCQWCSCKLVVPITAQANPSGMQKLRCAKCRQVSTFKLPVLSAAELKQQLQQGYPRTTTTPATGNRRVASETGPLSPNSSFDPDTGAYSSTNSPLPPTRSVTALSAAAAAKKLAQTRGIAAAVSPNSAARVTMNGQRVLTELAEKAASERKGSSNGSGQPRGQGITAGALGRLKGAG